MTTSLNISALGQTGNTNSLLGKGVAASQDGILAFLNLLAGQAGGGQGGQDIAAKIAEILKQGQTDQPSLAALLQKLFPDASAEQIQQALASLQTPDAATETVKPSLTSDLSATLAIDAQENPDILAQLREKFAALMNEGEVTPDRLAHFRKEAIDFLKSQGVARADMDKYMVSLATDLGDRLTVPLAAQLGMPVPPQAAATAQATAQASEEVAVSAEIPADATDVAPVTSGGEETAAADTSVDAMTGLDFLQQQLAQTAPEDTPEADAAKQGIQLRAKADVSYTPPAPAADDGQAQRQENAPAQRAQPVHPSLVNSLAQGGTGYGNGDSPSQMFQNGNGQMGLSGMMHAADKASAQSFVNYMTSGASATQTTQMIAMHIQRNAHAGVNTFTMQLEPAELGRLEVRMRFGRDGGIRAHLIADKPETLSMLQNDSAQLSRILQQAGLDADDNSLSFDLRHQGQHRDTEQSYNGAGEPGGYDAPVLPDAVQAKMAVLTEGYIRPGGVNIMV